MIIKILGSGAGGGFPQWNCNGTHSANVRARKPGYRARTQSSLAVSADGKNWALLNASPDLRQQIADTPELHPDKTGAKRNSPIKATVLTNADVDHIVGLIHLRERQPFAIFASEQVMATLDSNSIFEVCARDIVPRFTLALDKPAKLSGDGIDLGLTVTPFAVPGKIALFLEHGSATDNYGSRAGDTIGLEVKDDKTGKTFFYIPGCAEIDKPLAERIKGADLIFFDGTLFTNDEMITQGLLDKTGARMGHISMSGPDGSVEAVKPLAIKRRVYVHINNSNPALDENSPERKYVEAAGWEVGYDGMEVRL